MWANTEYSPKGYRVSIYRICTPHMEDISERDQRLNPISSVSCVFSVVLMGRETGSLHLLAPLLLTGGKGADLVIHVNIVLNTNYPQFSSKPRGIDSAVSTVASAPAARAHDFASPPLPQATRPRG
jgi:hypothetical protein